MSVPYPSRSSLSHRGRRIDGLRAAACACALALAACAGDGPVDAGPPPVERVVVAASDERLWPGSVADLSAAVYDASGAAVAAPHVAWVSSNPAVVEVLRNPDGAAMARGLTVGTATVRATVDGVEGSMQLRVEPGGEIRIRYSGPRNGEFVASGPAPEDEGVGVSQTRLVRMDGMMIFFGLQVHADGSSDWFQMQLPNFPAFTDWGFPANCVSVRCVDWTGIVFDESWNGRLENQKTYMSLFGTVQVTEHRVSRIKVRFSGSFCEVYYWEPYLPSCMPDADHPTLWVEGTVDMPL